MLVTLVASAGKSTQRAVRVYKSAAKAWQGHCETPAGGQARLSLTTSVCARYSQFASSSTSSAGTEDTRTKKNMAKEQDAPPPPKPAPAVSSCAGLLWFTSEMKTAGRPPYCFGRRGELKAGAEALEKIAKNDDQQKDDKPSEGFTYACLGYAQATAKMTREGKLPLCDVGVRFALLRAADTNEQRKKKALAAARRRDTVGTTAGISPRDEDELSKKASGVLTYMANGIQTFVSKASRFWAGALTNYPEKFGNFTDKMTRALQNHTKYLVKLCRKALAWRPSE